MSKNDPAERSVWDIRGKTPKQYSAKEKTRIVVSGLRGGERRASLACATNNASARVCIVAGRRNSSKPARSGSLSANSKTQIVEP